MHLHEAHLPVADTDAAQRFYVEIVGLHFAHRDLTRDIIFLWADANRRSMLGLWGPTTTLGREPHKCHIAFNVSLPELPRRRRTTERLGHPDSEFCWREND
jgi:lactoylglutathione lyase